ncbi:MAG: acyltransferase [Bacteroidota bacterium]|nr:acyltransferase [Bacteroidota bacterium]
MVKNHILNRNFGLDLIRTLAILLVLIAHSGVSLFLGVKIGIIGVEIFFVLSGFLIGQILIRDFSADVNPRVVLNFWIRRWFRTLPLYYAILLIKFIFIDNSLQWKILVYFVFLQNNFVGIDFMPVSWSLVIEEWFYLLVPIMLIVIFRNGLTKKGLTIFLITFIIAENLARLFWVLYADRGYAGIVGNFPFRLDSLMVGVLLANLKLNYRMLYDKMKGVIFFVIALAFCFVLLAFFGNANEKGLKDELLWTRTLWFCLISISFALQIPFVETIQIKHGNYFGRIITWISLYTYSIYLLHPYIFGAVITHKGTNSWYWQFPLAMLITFIAGAIIYRFYEKPMMDLRDKVNVLKK